MSVTPRVRAVKNEFSMSGMRTAMICELPIRSRRALPFGTNPSAAAAARTASAFAVETLVPLNTRDTVAVLTPARSATS
jgi:hypothetical protein